MIIRIPEQCFLRRVGQKATLYDHRRAGYTIYHLLNEQKKKGVAVLYIGEDLDVLLELCDRIMVLCHGEITGIVKSDEVTKEEIGLMMAGEKKAGKDGATA